MGWWCWSRCSSATEVDDLWQRGRARWEMERGGRASLFTWDTDGVGHKSGGSAGSSDSAAAAAVVFVISCFLSEEKCKKKTKKKKTREIRKRLRECLKDYSVWSHRRES